RQRLRDALVVAEISVTLALLVGAGLLLRSFAHLRNADIGVNSENLSTMVINLPETKYPTLAARRSYFNQLLDRARNTPGITGAAISSEIPLQGGNNGYIKVDGEDDPALSKQLVGWNLITPDYFRTLAIPLLEGRNFDSADLDRTAAATQKIFDLFKAAHGARVKMPSDLTLVAIIGQTTARTFWKNQDPVGRSFRWNDVKVTVIGVVGDVKEYGIRANVMPQAYYPLPLALGDGGYGHLTVKAAIPPAAVLSAMRGHVRSLDSSLAVSQPQTMREIIAGDTRDISLQAFLLGAFAILALLLAAVGLYGVMSYLVTQRTREIGIRMALGAQQSNVLHLIMKQGSKLTLIGIVLGALASLALTRSMSSLLYQVGPADPLTFACVAAILLLVRQDVRFY
ncbi:MAG: putative transport system permease protein, partial [Acidobacteriaceae bacterium]|nr:putative transport system permease protein [Acidobacteriaceae bacterium]